MREYIHYGATKLHPITPIKNEYHFTKPYGGLWASPVDAKFGWDAWCQREHFRVNNEENSFRFKLKDDARVYHIYSKKDLADLPKQKNDYGFSTFCCLDFEKIEESYDGIELHLSDEKIESEDDFVNGLYFSLYGWDCDSILIFNDKAIEVISRHELIYH